MSTGAKDESYKESRMNLRDRLREFKSREWPDDPAAAVIGFPSRGWPPFLSRFLESGELYVEPHDLELLDRCIESYEDAAEYAKNTSVWREYFRDGAEVLRAVRPDCVSAMAGLPPGNC